ncbi:MAG: hypothetical protein PVI99_00720 [Anaerolineales bacterium]|jgi:hypothetical protein
MNKQTVREKPGLFAARGDLTLVTLFSVVAALLMAVASAAGLFFPAIFYPTEELFENFAVNDVVNLVLILPILLASMLSARRGELIGLLFWQGALLAVVYNYLVYIFGMPLDWKQFFYVPLVILSGYALVRLVAAIDSQYVRDRLAGRVKEKLSGGLLIGFGILIAFRAVSMLVGSLSAPAGLPATEIGVLISDLTSAILWLLGGVFLWRHKALGYVTGAGLLFQASMLFVGLIAFLLLQPVMTDAPFMLVDVAVVTLMGLVCSIPFVFFVRGVISSRFPD